VKTMDLFQLTNNPACNESVTQILWDRRQTKTPKT